MRIDIFRHEDNWQAVKDKVAECEPELASCMVRECVYRGFCPEMFGCGYDQTEAFREEVVHYRSTVVGCRGDNECWNG